ncbi:MAG: hypothetical protein HY756_00870 [Nitrospirae bacterium]|nr:hypothetical protein [Nitrospirota bacterium]
MAIGYLSLLALLFVIKCAVWLLESKAVYSPDKLLKLKKPFFLGKAKWELIRENALLHKVSQDRFCDFINMLKPYYFTDQKIDFSEPEN